MLLPNEPHSNVRCFCIGCCWIESTREAHALILHLCFNINCLDHWKGLLTVQLRCWRQPQRLPRGLTWCTWPLTVPCPLSWSWDHHGTNGSSLKCATIAMLELCYTLGSFEKSRGQESDCKSWHELKDLLSEIKHMLAVPTCPGTGAGEGGLGEYLPFLKSTQQHHKNKSQ